jgi:hypothetical protein
VSTNYYVVIDPCPECGRAAEPMHIGSGSCLRGYFHYPESDDYRPRITTWKEWRAFLLALPPTCHIEDEYGNTHEASEFVEQVEATSPDARRRQFDWEVRHERHHSRPRLGDVVPEGTWLDPDGFSFYGSAFS